MAVDKFSSVTDFAITPLLKGQTLLEDTLARFDEQVSTQEPGEIRRRLKKRLGNVRVNINGQFESEV